MQNCAFFHVSTLNVLNILEFFTPKIDVFQVPAPQGHRRARGQKLQNVRRRRSVTDQPVSNLLKQNLKSFVFFANLRADLSLKISSNLRVPMPLRIGCRPPWALPC